MELNSWRELAAEEFNDTYESLLPMEDKTLEGYKALSDAIALDLAGRRSPEQRLAALKADGWQDDALVRLAQAIDACGNPESYIHAAAEFNGNWEFHELPRMAPETLQAYKALSQAIGRDFIFRNPFEVFNRLKSGGWKNEHFFQLKAAIDNCNDSDESRAAAATVSFNRVYVGPVLPSMSAETLENYKKFSSAIPYSLALGQDAEAPMHKDTNDELMAQLKAHP